MASWLVVQEALATASRCESSHIRGELASLALRLAALGDIDRALSLARAIQDWPEKQAEALTGVAQHLCADQRAAVLAEAAWVACNIQNPIGGGGGHINRRAQLLAPLAGQLAHLPVDTVHTIWRETTHMLAQNTRQELLADSGTLAPVVVALDSGAVEGMRAAVVGVARWWP